MGDDDGNCDGDVDDGDVDDDYRDNGDDDDANCDDDEDGVVTSSSTWREQLIWRGGGS